MTAGFDELPRLARVYDHRDDSGRPVAVRASLPTPLRDRLLTYLDSAPIVLAARSFEVDEFIPSVQDVPLTFRTDGVWIWSGAVSHYLRKHAFPPDPDLVRHIIARDFQLGEVSPEAKDLAVRVITTG
ncbi:hypothetical protein D7D52_28360 [Nocardia yunnanensis]|uniref:Uncharacterized protein n=1 Tax=Nocardia yunnanensis TaxID=2382165 RepID=A0A386ZHW0_9NOCA|nr:hypothetical protein D7D52_28360 [Nocardia yunnanensis]